MMSQSCLHVAMPKPQNTPQAIFVRACGFCVRSCPLKKHLLRVTWVEKQIIFSNNVVELWFYVHDVKDNTFKSNPTFKDTGSKHHSLLYTIKFASIDC